jgi:hypothetical protein|tara:strand:- start:461 stop:1201 length:741 start_codon:yes stop_codon:yes gene_type:complete
MPKTVSAHQPFTLCIEDNSSAPTVFISDGSVSHALYFSFTNSDQRFALDMRLPANERLNISMLILNQAPENTMPQEQLPYITIPSLGEMLEPTIRTSFYEPYSQTDYIRFLRYNSNQLEETKTIGIQVHARSSGYFVLSLGYKEENRNIVIGGDVQQKNGKNCLIAPNINNVIPEDKQTINNIQPAKEKEAKNSTELLEYHNQNEKNEEIVEINKNTNNIVFLIPILTTLLIGISIFAYYRINKKV